MAVSLERLWKLKTEGAISQDEFEGAKANLARKPESPRYAARTGSIGSRSGSGMTVTPERRILES